MAWPGVAGGRRRRRPGGDGRRRPGGRRRRRRFAELALPWGWYHTIHPAISISIALLQERPNPHTVLAPITFDYLEHQLHPHGAVPAGQHQHVCHHRIATAEVEGQREPQRRCRGRLHCRRRQHQVRHERGEDDAGAGRGVEQQARVLQGRVEAVSGERVGALVGGTRLPSAWSRVSARVRGGCFEAAAEKLQGGCRVRVQVGGARLRRAAREEG